MEILLYVRLCVADTTCALREMARVLARWPEILPVSVNYRGEVAREELPFASFTGFGLSWDGWNVPDMSIEGRYTKYNASLRVSNYLAYGLPVIVWEGAAVAEEILNQGVGLACDDLNNIDRILSNLSQDSYRAMCEKAASFAQVVRSGNSTKKALIEAVEWLGKR